jgi:hypothetical protein
MSFNSARKKRISDAEWEAHKAEIRRLYIADNKTLENVVEELAKGGFYVRQVVINGS